MQLYLDAAATVLQPGNLLVTFIGVFLGVIVGALPGLTSTLGLALLIPATFTLDAIPGLLLLGGMYGGSIYGGSITAILINIPGTPSSTATCIDGYPMTKQGRAGEALGIAVVASCFGGIFGTIVLLLAAPPLARVGLMFGPPEQFWVALFGVTVIISVAGDSFLKGLISGCIGLLLATVGSDIATGFPRFMFGQIELYEGIPLVPAIVGLFCVPEIVNSINSRSRVKFDPSWGRVKNIVPSWSLLNSLKATLLRSSIIGTIVGIIPGAGTPIAVFIAYGEAKRASRESERFGHGAVEGVAAPEAANNAVEGGSLVPLLALGIPGNAVSAIYLSALLVHGLTPGPDLFRLHADIVYPVIFGLLTANLLMLFVGVILIKLTINLLRVPNYVLNPVIIVFSVAGTYAMQNSFFDVGLMLGFGLLGIFMGKFGFSVIPLVLALILGPIAENAFSQSVSMLDGNLLLFATRPICLVLIVLTLASAIFGCLREFRARSRRNPILSGVPE
jgi:putative tricarboxylic transport membrane protein